MGGLDGGRRRYTEGAPLPSTGSSGRGVGGSLAFWIQREGRGGEESRWWPGIPAEAAPSTDLNPAGGEPAADWRLYDDGGSSEGEIESLGERVSELTTNINNLLGTMQGLEK